MLFLRALISTVSASASASAAIAASVAIAVCAFGAAAWGQSSASDAARVPLPQPLPADVPPASAVAASQGPLTDFLNQAIAAQGPLRDEWTSAMGRPPSLANVLPDGWKWRGGASVLGGVQGLGGLSGLEVERQSNGRLSVVAVSDGGYWLTGELSRRGLGHFDTLQLTPPLAIKTRPGARAQESQDNAEALALTAQGELLVAFEGDHRVQRHFDLNSTPSVLSVPTALRTAFRNGGIEALAALPDGRFFAVGEGVNRQGGLRAWVFGKRSGDWPTMVYRKQVEDGNVWNPTAAAVMGDRLLLVERWWDKKFSFKTRLVAIDLDDIAANASLQPDVLFDLTPLVGAFGNIEGLAITPSPNGHYAVFVTDNQQIGLLPTLMFVLEFQGQR